MLKLRVMPLVLPVGSGCLGSAR